MAKKRETMLWVLDVQLVINTVEVMVLGCGALFPGMTMVP